MAAGLSPHAAPRDDGRLRTGAREHPHPTSRTVSLTAAFPAVLAGCILAGFVFRLLLIDRFPLRADEAIYGFWAR